MTTHTTPPRPVKSNVVYYPLQFHEKYGEQWPVAANDLSIELACFREGRTIEQGGLGKPGHFKEIVNMLWGPHNERSKFIWTPWADTMLENACKHKYLAVSGCANSGKSLFFAVWAIVNFLVAPWETMVLITSTSLKQSQGRIWGVLTEYWQAAQHVTGNGLPGKLVDSIGAIRFFDPAGEFKASAKFGIHLIAGEKKKEKEAVGKLVGLKAGRLILIADELAELSHALLEAGYGNLSSQQGFQMIGISNPASVYDPHGKFSTPKRGWASVSVADDEWETETGWHIRFDATKSPNVLADRTIYKFLPTKQSIEAARSDTGGDDSAMFWRMWRGMWSPFGSTESVVSEADLIKFACEESHVDWQGGIDPLECSFFDPSFTTGGDRAVAHFGRMGMSNGVQTLLYTGFVQIDEDVTNKKDSRAFQLVAKWRDLCAERKITPDRASFDNTGAAAFGDIVATLWSRQVTATNFGGAASKLRVSAHDKTLACDKYANRATEIWCSIKEFIRSNQIRGVTAALGKELTSRRMKPKSSLGGKDQIETKEVYRTRAGRSPDIADSALGLLDFLRAKFRFRAAERTSRAGEKNVDWHAFVKKRDTISQCPNILDRAA